MCHSASTIFYDEFLAFVNPIICLSFVESYRRGLSNILCPCGRNPNGNVTPKCGEINLMKVTKLPEEKAVDRVSRTQKTITKPLILLYRDTLNVKLCVPKNVNARLH